MTFSLTRNAYSPRLLSEDLHGIVKPDFIRKQVAAGKIKAQRFGGKNIVILRADAEAWLANLPSATAPTNLGGSEDKPAKPAFAVRLRSGSSAFSAMRSERSTSCRPCLAVMRSSRLWRAAATAEVTSKRAGS